MSKTENVCPWTGRKLFLKKDNRVQDGIYRILVCYSIILGTHIITYSFLDGIECEDWTSLKGQITGLDPELVEEYSRRTLDTLGEMKRGGEGGLVVDCVGQGIKLLLMVCAVLRGEFREDLFSNELKEKEGILEELGRKVSGLENEILSLREICNEKDELTENLIGKLECAEVVNDELKGRVEELVCKVEAVKGCNRLDGLKSAPRYLSRLTHRVAVLTQLGRARPVALGVGGDTRGSLTRAVTNPPQNGSAKVF